MLELLLAANIICNIGNGTCTIDNGNTIILQQCFQGDHSNRGIKPKRVISSDGQQVVIYYVTCEEA